jgi:hypothetical protein
MTVARNEIEEHIQCSSCDPALEILDEGFSSQIQWIHWKGAVTLKITV